MGMYLGKVRARGGSIRGFEGAAGGVIRWIRVINDTAVAVDQLGMRQGAAAVYLDAWHMDLPEFLQLRTNNGDDRMKAHDLFPAVCYPDLFWKMAKTTAGRSRAAAMILEYGILAFIILQKSLEENNRYEKTNL